MTEESTKLIQQLMARRFDDLPAVQSPEQRKGALGIVNLFALASHMLTAMSGTLAIVSVEKDVAGDWHAAGACDEVHRLVDLAVQTSASLTRLLGMAMVALHSEQITTRSATERHSIQQLVATGYLYVESLNAVSLEATNMARWRGLWGRGGYAHCPLVPSQQFDPERDRARESVRTLIAQIIELGLRAELFDGTWAME